MTATNAGDTQNDDASLDEPALLHAFFARAAARYPDHVAIDVPPGPERPERRTLTYAELGGRAAGIAERLRASVSGPCVVGIFIGRDNPALFAAQLAVLEVGAAWTSVDPTAPDAAAHFVFEDAAAVVVLTDAAGRARADVFPVDAEHVLDVDAIGPAHPGSSPPPSWLDPQSLAYVIYTSGSTGQPKGVLIEHRSVANLVGSDLETFSLTSDDRVAQGSSPAYDSSLEETWLAFAAGATLVVMDDEAVRRGPDLVAWLRDERVSVLCPPPTLLRTTGCDDPAAELPDLRLVYVGGEALESDVVERWAPGRWLENGYGPTECTVTVLRTRVRVGEPVTIGTPVRGHRAHVLDDALEDVPDGEPGELVIAGIGLARGYLGAPELTAEKFPEHPRLGRIYRTGDLVRRDADGNYHFLGRIDAQVKVRGHRVEPGQVEAALVGCAGVREAACMLEGDALAAFVVPSDPARPPRVEAIAATLRAQLPEHMVPTRFAVLDALPTLASGKIDRRALPHLARMRRDGDRPVVAPRDDVERRVVDAIACALGLGSAPSVFDDFFLDLGGTSVSAAQLISTLRDHPDTAALAVRDVYAGRTAEALAGRAREADSIAAPRTGRGGARGRPLLCTAVQGAWLLVGLGTAAIIGFAVWFYVVPWLLDVFDLVPLLLLGPFLGLALAAVWTPFSVWLAACFKRLLIGRYEPLRAPVWGGFYLRNWLVQSLTGIVPWGWLSDTVFLNAALRRLGARIGSRVHVHRGVDFRRGGWDLLDIGDDAVIGQDAALRVVDLVDGEVVVGPVVLGEGAVVDVRAGVDRDAEVGAHAHLTALSWLRAGERVPEGQRFGGVPATPEGNADTPPEPTRMGRAWSPAAHGVLVLLARFVRVSALYYVGFVLPAWLLIAAFDVDVARVLMWLFEPLRDPIGPFAMIGLAIVALVLGTVLTALSVRISRVRPGVVGRFTAGYVHVLTKTDAVRAANTLLSGTLLWPVWLRLAGMRIGRKCEISTVIDVVPETIEIGAESFLADGIYLGGPRLYPGVVEIGTTRLGRGTFLGNHVVVPTGVTLPDDVLVGVCTVADDGVVQPGTSWFGHPAFELPRREVVSADRSVTHDPGPLRLATRLTWELARFLLPVAPLVVLFAWLGVLGPASEVNALGPFLAVVLPVTTFAAAASLWLLVLALKWCLLGRVRPGQHPLWSCWCSRWDFLYVAWGAWSRPTLATFEGTLFLAWFLRAMGMRIGKRVVLGRGFAQVVDPDMLCLEDGATVNALFQAHSFEDRVLKIGAVRVGARASVGSAAVLFYGADVGDDALVSPQTVVMKHERLTPGTVYEGVPSSPTGA